MPVGPSTHLSWSELACKDSARTPYPMEWRRTRVVDLAQAFEVVRRACGSRPITVQSGYRTPAWNRRVGGATFSQHVEGRALDLAAPMGLTRMQFYEIIRAQARASKIRGIGIYPTFIHVDVRPSNRLVIWHGSRAWAELP
jgi:uncharacterized protein YcbK (DUF882 family)